MSPGVEDAVMETGGVWENTLYSALNGVKKFREKFFLAMYW
jgi:hypothetical protein